MDDIKLYATTINYKASYSLLKPSQETLKCHLGLKSAKYWVLQKGNKK
jgi:hypothetical protein